VIRRLPVVLSLVLVLAPTPLPAAAVMLQLSDGDRREAMHLGERSITNEAFDSEWRVVGGTGESLVVMSPFHRLVLASRNAAFKNEPLKPNDIERVVKQDANRLVVWANLRGGSEEFARYYVPRFMAGTREIKAVFVQNERTAVRQDDGRFLARCIYGFPIQNLTGRDRLALVVADADGRDVTRFTIDLSGMR
jgi:hypothetical protein